ncbi:MAG: three-Cys-motif partner protein TcmP [Thermoanaerobaculia bacterium]
MGARKSAKGSAHEFGGDWTTKKLNALSRYLAAYTTALKNQSFSLSYIDAFAGTGTRKQRDPADENKMTPLFPDLAEADSKRLLDGSARLALQVEPRFTRYIFIDQDRVHCASLERLKADFSDKAAAINVTCGDANHEIQRICSTTQWSSNRAVLFLDPYGMQVEWKTIEAVAATKAIDMWLLFPLGMGVNRVLKRDGNIPDSWRSRLNLLLGTEEWEQEFYRVEKTPTLFGEDEEWVTKASMQVIGGFFNRQLKTIFAGVADRPGVLRNLRGSPLYLFCFAAANPHGAPIALKIANHILKELG